MSDDPINLDAPINAGPQSGYLSEAEKRLFANPGTAKFRVFYEGKFFPVGRMLGADGQVVVNPLHAFACIAFAGQWTMLSCRPGDIEPIREGRPWI
jgi:hypothetical protein